MFYKHLLLSNAIMNLARAHMSGNSTNTHPLSAMRNIDFAKLPFVRFS